MSHPAGNEGAPGRGRPPLQRARQSIRRTPFATHARNQVAQGGHGRPGPTGGPSVGVDGTNPYDYSSDPLLQRIRAAGTERIGQSEAEALRQRKQLLIDYGDADLARSLGMDESTIAAAQNNPFSTRAALAKEQHDQPIALDNSLQRGNLYYSGTRGTQQANLATSLLGHASAAQQAIQGGLGDINSHLMDIRNQTNQDQMDAEQAAADRLQQQLGDLPMGVGMGGVGHRPSAAPRFPGVHARSGMGNRLAQMLRPRGHAMPRLPGRQP